LRCVVLGLSFACAGHALGQGNREPTVILAGPRLVRERPDVVAALQQLTARIDGDRIRRMNLAVDQEGASPAAVAEAFLQDVREERLGR
jgi:hypothetical protein